MYEATARSLRTSERFLIDPPLSAQFGSGVVSVLDISLKGARFRHAHALEMGHKSVLRLVIDGRPSPLSLEAVVVWTETDQMNPGKFISGVRTYAAPESIQTLFRTLQATGRITRIEELRSSDRFYIKPNLEAKWNEERVSIEDLCAHGAHRRRGETRCRESGPVAVQVAGRSPWHRRQDAGCVVEREVGRSGQASRRPCDLGQIRPGPTGNRTSL
jgi:hypothetical protein